MSKDEAYTQGYWIATFNLWMVRTQPEPALLMQMRSKQSQLEPNSLDVTVGGHYQSGETMLDGLREADEELGKSYAKQNLTFLGRKIYVGIDTKQRLRKNIVYVFIGVDNDPLTSFALQPEELDGLYICKIKDIISLFDGSIKTAAAEGIDSFKKEHILTYSLKSFPYNYDNYILKMASLATRYINGDRQLLI